MISKQLAILCVSAIETSLHQLSKQNRQLNPLLQSLNGKVIKIRLKQLSWPLYFICTEQILVMSQYDGAVDVSVKADAATLYQLTEGASLTELIKADKLIIEGELATLQSFSQYLQQLQFDWAEPLSKYIGDVPTHFIQTGLTQMASGLKGLLKSSSSHLSQLAIEEYRIAPHKLEYIAWCDRIEELNSETQALSQRITRLRNNIT
ncbi:MAG: sterol-binding protein [Shewanella sp.]|nr:sterol-binding protein [Shewanella sp.]